MPAGRVLAFAETRDSALRPVAGEAVTAARELAEALSSPVDAFLLGPPGIAREAAALGAYGADRIFVAENEAFASYAPDASLRLCAEILGRETYSAIIFPASAQGKDLAPRAAAMLDRGLATEVTGLGAEDGVPVAVRPVYAGKAIARVTFTDLPALISVRPNVFRAVKRPGEGLVESVEVAPEPSSQRVKGIETGERETLDVSEATVVVSGGRGMKDPKNWAVLEDLVDALGEHATLGASRAVVDAGWRPHAEQVGQTGKVVSPTLYFAIGISGAIQHLAGMRTAKTIVAINKDAEAPIFQIADLGIVGDLFEVVPALAAEIRRVHAES